MRVSLHFCVWAEDLTWAEQEAIPAASVTQPWVPPCLHTDSHPFLTPPRQRHISRNGCKILVSLLGIAFQQARCIGKVRTLGGRLYLKCIITASHKNQSQLCEFLGGQHKGTLPISLQYIKYQTFYFNVILKILIFINSQIISQIYNIFL